jgi:large subunit ribosomal protein L28
MARRCAICGKGPLSGNAVARRGRPRKQGGAGAHVLKRTRRQQRPNLQPVHAAVNGRRYTLRVCAKCLKAGKVNRA